MENSSRSSQWMTPSVIIQAMTALLFLGVLFSRMLILENVVADIPRQYVRRDIYFIEHKNLETKIDELIRELRVLKASLPQQQQKT